jgi:hypothetical protein
LEYKKYPGGTNARLLICGGSGIKLFGVPESRDPTKMPEFSASELAIK